MSVIVCCSAGRPRLSWVLRALSAQTESVDEVLLAGPPGAAPAACEFPYHADANPNRARNRAMAAARGRVVMLLEGATAPHPGWVRAHMTALARSGGIAVGRVVDGASARLSARPDALRLEHALRLAAAAPRAERSIRRGPLAWSACTSVNLAAHAEAFERAGGFDEGMETIVGADRLWALNARAAGVDIRPAPEAWALEVTARGRPPEAPHSDWARLLSARPSLDAEFVAWRGPDAPMQWRRTIDAVAGALGRSFDPERPPWRAVLDRSGVLRLGVLSPKAGIPVLGVYLPFDDGCATRVERAAWLDTTAEAAGSHRRRGVAVRAFLRRRG